MYITDQIRSVFETCEIDTIAYKINEYLLLHMDKIEMTPLSEIAREIGISKSAVSKYIHNNYQYDSYINFQMAIEQERHSHKSLQNEELEDSRRYAAWFDRVIGPVADEAAIRELAAKIYHAGRVIIYGSIETRCMFPVLIRDLFRHKVVARTVSRLDKAELLSMNEDDVFIICAPHNTFREVRLRLIGSTDLFERLKAQMYFVGNVPENQMKVKSVKIAMPNTIFEEVQFMMYFSARLIMANPSLLTA